MLVKTLCLPLLADTFLASGAFLVKKIKSETIRRRHETRRFEDEKTENKPVTMY